MYDCVDVSYHHWNIQNDGTIINAGCGLPIAEAADGSIILANNENTYVFKWSLKPTEVCLPKCNLESVFADESMTVNDQITLLANHFEARPEVKSLEQLIKQGGTNLEESINKACFNLVLETKEGKAASCLARFIDSTISIGISGSVGLQLTTVEAGLSLIWGEGGQGACSLSTSAGFASKSIAGVGASASASISPAFLGFGGWDSVGSPVTHPELCLSVGWDIPATPASIAATVSVDLTKIQSPETAIANIKEAFTLSKDFFTKDRLKEKTFQGAVKEIGTEVELMASFLRNGNLNALGITSVGVDVGVGFDLFWEYADIKTAWLLPEVSVTACIEYVMACKGTGCDEKLQQLDDATPLLEGITCQLCKNRATWWYGYKACGKRPEKVIENKANGKVFDVENGFPLTNGRRVIAYPNSGEHINSVQGWVRGPDYLNNREDPYSTIRVASKHLVDFCLDLDNGICNAGTKVQIWDCHHGIEQNQQWYQSPEGTIYSKKCGAGLVLAEAADGAIILAGNEHTDAMKWSQVPL